MDGNKINYEPRMTLEIVKNKQLRNSKLYLIDVGASGGFDPCWNAFDSYLAGTGFDPLIKECNRLNSTNTNPQFSYVPSYIVSENEEIDKYRTPETIKFHETVEMFARSSGWDAMQNLKLDYLKEIFNKGETVVKSEGKTSLDRYISENSISGVDFIKVDTDGFDFSVLKGAEKILDNYSTLGIFVECDMNAPFHPHSNSYRNIDYFLSEKGFRLYDLQVWRYSKKDLPGKFMYKIPAQTSFGQVSWGDALFFRDFVDMKIKGIEIPPLQVIKMACVQEVFGLPDCAAELLNTFRKELCPFIDVSHCLDLLSQNVGLYKSYQEHIRNFKNKPESFFPQDNNKKSIFRKVGGRIKRSLGL